MSYVELSQDFVLRHDRLEIAFVSLDSVLVMDPQTALDLELLID